MIYRPKDELAYPMQNHVRQDGREVRVVRRLDFRGEHESFSIADDERRLLIRGATFGAILRYHWPGFVGPPNERAASRSQVAHLLGTYDGEETELTIPLKKWHPDGPQRETIAPVLDFKVWTPNGRKIEVGRAAVACFKEQERPVIGAGIDHTALQSALGLKARQSYEPSYLGKVQTGGLYHILPIAAVPDTPQSDQNPSDLLDEQ